MSPFNTPPLNRQRPERNRSLFGSLKASLQMLGYRATTRPLDDSTAIKVYDSEVGNTAFWSDAMMDSLWDGKRIELRQFSLTEWVPLQPGLTSHPRSRNLQALALEHTSINQRLGPHFNPYGKLQMLESGVGCARYNGLWRNNSVSYLLGASSSHWCDEGIPLLLDEGVFGSVADQLRDIGSVTASMSGRIQLIPEVVINDRPGGRVPSYCLRVESLEIENARLQESPLVRAFITFTPSCNHEDSTLDWFTTYCGFRPGRQELGVNDAVGWFKSYIEQYSSSRCRIVADFDAYHRYFDGDDVELPLPERLSGRVSPDTLQRLSTSGRMSIAINGDVILGDQVLGDQFKNVRESNIFNRSAYVFDPKQ